MTDFEALFQANLHCISVGPYETTTHELVRSDIVLHLPVLQYFSSLCGHATEFGTRDGHSTTALIAGCKGEVHSYDIERTRIVDTLNGLSLPAKWAFHLGDTSDASLDVQETDLLFIDTLHTYAHIKKELTLWGRKARKYLAFHDVFTCGERDVSGPNRTAKGILPAIEEFLAQYPREYQVAYETKWSNGLLVLRRAA